MAIAADNLSVVMRQESRMLLSLPGLSGGRAMYHSEGPDLGHSRREPERVTPWCRHVVSGVDLLRNPKYNKGMAFSEQERDHLHLRGLMPPVQLSQTLQMERVMANVRSIDNKLEKYNHLMALQERNHRLFYKVLHDNIDELLPVVGFPTVGMACQKYGLIFRRPRGLFLSMADRGRVHSILTNWPETRVKLIVVTDGERILGLGDLGLQGMGIPVSKLAWAVAAAGITPHETLPVLIDVGTDNEDLLEDKFYFGLRHRRVRGEAYDDLMDEFVDAAQRRFGEQVVFQFTAFDYVNAMRLLLRHRARAVCFNDDLQGTAAIGVSGLLEVFGREREGLGKQKYLFVGAGESGVTFADLLAYAISRYETISLFEAREKIWLFDSKGLVVRDRVEELQYHKLPYVQDHPKCDKLIDAVKALKPNVIIGTTTTSFTKAKTFTQEVCCEMAKNNEHPVIFALSGRHSTLSVEETQEVAAQDAYNWTNGKVHFLGGAQEAAVNMPDGSTRHPRCAYTVYIYPGVALGLRLSAAHCLRDEMLLAAAECLVSQVTDEDRELGAIYPDIAKIRDISAKIAAAVACKAYHLGVARHLPMPRNLLKEAQDMMYQLNYRMYR
eukprot:CAMPEP_0114237652 /NCGR_PEP_ID=MMETSP0058-20121206/7505_1 /TAXON_ID=36894 /ORGANISM="Pyramimonas parkeae, CCMP726" /LENGTH=609 /DNA_ID=CAMNT_0001349709 /DNA_START=72 /DNA_END=1902 /DNA_ORIENTATION=+